MKTKNVIARYAFYAFGGVAVLGIEYGIDDKIKWSWEDTATGLGRVNTSKVRTDDDGNDYFIAGGQRVPLAECIRMEAVQ